MCIEGYPQFIRFLCISLAELLQCQLIVLQRNKKKADALCKTAAKFFVCFLIL
jgi:hypothetical protein